MSEESGNATLLQQIRGLIGELVTRIKTLLKERLPDLGSEDIEECARIIRMLETAQRVSPVAATVGNRLRSYLRNAQGDLVIKIRSRTNPNKSQSVRIPTEALKAFVEAINSIKVTKGNRCTKKDVVQTLATLGDAKWHREQYWRDYRFYPIVDFLSRIGAIERLGLNEYEIKEGVTLETVLAQVQELPQVGPLSSFSRTTSPE